MIHNNNSALLIKHASTHAAGGADEITPESIGAKAATESDIFYAVYQETSYADVKAAVDAGKHVFCKYLDIYLCPLYVDYSSSLSRFYFYGYITMDSSEISRIAIELRSNGWQTAGTESLVTTTILRGLIKPPTSDAVYTALSAKADSSTVTSHTGNTTNPHGVTKSQVGLGNVTNDAQVKRSEMGVASGVATLDTNGKVPTSQLTLFTVSTSAPSDTNIFWIDSANNYIAKIYYNGSWTALGAVFK